MLLSRARKVWGYAEKTKRSSKFSVVPQVGKTFRSRCLHGAFDVPSTSGTVETTMVGQVP
jgi:hypothetical protein